MTRTRSLLSQRKSDSMILKLKSIVYRYTGVYLAGPEELEYLKSDEFWSEFYKIYSHPNNNMSPRNIQGLKIGIWQAKNRFTRPWVTFCFFERPYFVFRPINSILTSLTAIKWDIGKLFKRFL